MSRQSIDNLGELQRGVMEVVWERGEATVHDVRRRLDRQKEPAYTTVLTVMQKLEKAGWLTHRTEGSRYVYFPTRSREEAGAGSVKRFVKRVFDGDAVAMFGHLIRTGDLTEDDLLELRKMINEKRKEMRK
jgi:predicted transcriptional regulator